MDLKWSGSRDLELYMTIEPQDLLIGTQGLFNGIQQFFSFLAALLVKDRGNMLRPIFEECLSQLLLLYTVVLS